MAKALVKQTLDQWLDGVSYEELNSLEYLPTEFSLTQYGVMGGAGLVATGSTAREAAPHHSDVLAFCQPGGIDMTELGLKMGIALGLPAGVSLCIFAFSELACLIMTAGL